MPSEEAPIHDGGFSKLTWGLLGTFGTVLLLISTAALTKLFDMNERMAAQSGDIRVILTNQEYYARGQDGLATDVKAIDERLRIIELRQAENARHAVR
jgi:hypothetical protein